MLSTRWHIRRMGRDGPLVAPITTSLCGLQRGSVSSSISTSPRSKPFLSILCFSLWPPALIMTLVCGRQKALMSKSSKLKLNVFVLTGLLTVKSSQLVFLMAKSSLETRMAMSSLWLSNPRTLCGLYRSVLKNSTQMTTCWLQAVGIKSSPSTTSREARPSNLSALTKT